MKRCLFCQVDLVTTKNHVQQKTNEHIFPKWLQEKYGIKKKPLSFSFLEARSDDGATLQLTPPPSERSVSLNSFLLGNICAGCNNGWMSDLENKSKVDLIGLHDGSQTNITDKRSLSIWCAKTSFILSSYLRPNVGALPEEWARWLFARRSELPWNTAVFYSFMEKPRYWFSIPSTHQIQAESHAKAQDIYKTSSKVVFQLGHAAFQVVWSEKARSLSHHIADTHLVDSSISISPVLGSSVRCAGINDDLFVFMMSNGLIA